MKKYNKEYKSVKLGHFSYNKGGRIFLAPGLNMEYDSGSASCMHEMYHSYLALTSNMGILMHLLELEINLEDKNDVYIFELLNIQKELYNATRVVQEVYANSLEMLWLQENYGEEECRRIYHQKTKEYKDYLAISEKIWKDTQKKIPERRKRIHDICKEVLDIDISTDAFWNSVKELGEGSKDYLVKYQLEERLYKAFVDGESLQNTRELDQQDVLNLAYSRFKYVGKCLEESQSVAEESLNQRLNELLLETISTFELSELGIRYGKKYRSDSDFIFIVHNIITNAGDRIDNGLIQYFSGKCEYNLLDLEIEELNSIISKRESVILFDTDYDFSKNKPKYIKCENTPIFVMINDAKEFKRRIKDFAECEEIYIADLNEKDEKSFFTIIFFRKRNNDNIMFMFPTLSILSEKILTELNLEARVRNPGNEKGFYDIFSCFNDRVKILEILKNVVSFVTKAKGNIMHNENKCSPLLNAVKHDVGCNIFNIESKKHLHIQACLPTTYTIAEPFWIIMEFVNGENNGNIISHKGKVENEEEKIGVLYFKNKRAASLYLQQKCNINCADSKYEIVGMDEVFWDVLKIYLEQKNLGMIYYDGDVNKCVWNSAEQFDYLRKLALNS